MTDQMSGALEQDDAPASRRCLMSPARLGSVGSAGLLIEIMMRANIYCFDAGRGAHSLRGPGRARAKGYLVLLLACPAKRVAS